MHYYQKIIFRLEVYVLSFFERELPLTLAVGRSQQREGDPSEASGRRRVAIKKGKPPRVPEDTQGGKSVNPDEQDAPGC